MNEAQTKHDLIEPALREAGWGVVEGSRLRLEFPITQGRLIGQNRRATPLFADYVLEYKNRRIGVVEAKKRDLYYTEGVGQAKDYAGRLNIRFTYATNGLQIYGIDMEEGTEGDVAKYPTPDELWEMTFPTPKENYKIEIAHWRERLFAVPFEDRGGTWQPRYYQNNAITKALDAIANKKDRILLTMATGTGKTAIAFQIAWKLFHARWNLFRDGKRAPRILFLADRNILADQAFNAFGAFEDDALVRIRPSDIKKKGRVPKNGSIFFTIFQSFMSGGSASSPTAKETDVEFDEIEVKENAFGFMYILQCADGSFYTGSTKELSLRIEQHKNGEGANFTANNLPVKLVYYETFDRIDEAFAREKQIQKWSRAKKIALIQGDIEKLKNLSNSKAVPEPFQKVAEPAEAYFGEYPKDFFDLIIIDECHRGGANDESSWRAIMDYFSPAVQLGLTATPKRDVNIDTYKYFGDPVYIYSLKEGINDGFLTPFKVKEISTTIDEYQYTPDDSVEEGEVDYERQYTEADFNRIIEIKAREEYRVKLFMDLINQNQKTLVFCASQIHAAAIRDLINQQADSTNPNYCHRVTADDGKLGEQHLRDFQDNEKSIPTILTTSQKLSTGVDAPEVRNIVLLRQINSMVEFKQIIGRGTRLFDSKDYFTIYDFVNAHNHFNDDEWDGPPLPPDEPMPRPEAKPCKVCGQRPCVCDRPEPKPCPECGNIPCVCETPPRQMIRVKLSDNKVREIDSMVSTSFWSPSGKPISAQEFIEQLFGDLPGFFKNEAELRKLWSQPGTRKKLLEELNEKGYTHAQLEDLRKLVHGEDSDLYDVLGYVAYHKDLVPRLDRAAKAKIRLRDYNPMQQEFLNFVLKQYVKEGVTELDDAKLPDLLELKYKAIADAKRELGDAKKIRETFIGFQEHLYVSRAV
jgi:superfamily II DNA or RNA helicase